MVTRRENRMTGCTMVFKIKSRMIIKKMKSRMMFKKIVLDDV